jgi:hypothetical protein
MTYNAGQSYNFTYTKTGAATVTGQQWGINPEAEVTLTNPTSSTCTVAFGNNATGDYLLSLRVSATGAVDSPQDASQTLTIAAGSQKPSVTITNVSINYSNLPQNCAYGPNAPGTVISGVNLTPGISWIVTSSGNTSGLTYTIEVINISDGNKRHWYVTGITGNYVSGFNLNGGSKGSTSYDNYAAFGDLRNTDGWVGAFPPSGITHTLKFIVRPVLAAAAPADLVEGSVNATWAGS